MHDQFQMTSIIAAAIRTCHQDSSKQRGDDPLSMEDANCLAKAVLSALTEAGLEIAPVGR